MTPRAIIAGAAGLIGQYLVKTASRWVPGWDVQGLSRAELELTETSKVEARIHALKPDLLIHCAALSRTKACEQYPQQARRINRGDHCAPRRTVQRHSLYLSIQRGGLRREYRLVWRDG